MIPFNKARWWPLLLLLGPCLSTRDRWFGLQLDNRVELNVTGTYEGNPVTGHGYVALTGYAGKFNQRI